MTDVPLRGALVAAAAGSVRAGLNHGTTGNLSVRTASGFLITPTGAPCDSLMASDLVAMDLGGNVIGRGREPSSEWRLHRDLYRTRPEVGGVVHAHPVFATTLACLRLDLPAVHYMIAVSGTSLIRCAQYATFGTAELSAAMLQALSGSQACLLANHGLVAAATDIQEALRVATEVENVAELYWRALQIGTPTILTDTEMTEVLARFDTYGQSPPGPLSP